MGEVRQMTKEAITVITAAVITVMPCLKKKKKKKKKKRDEVGAFNSAVDDDEGRLDEIGQEGTEEVLFY